MQRARPAVTGEGYHEVAQEVSLTVLLGGQGRLGPLLSMQLHELNNTLGGDA
jgi:hypothetical protein